jgi:hypothetical protein
LAKKSSKSSPTIIWHWSTKYISEIDFDLQLLKLSVYLNLGNNFISDQTPQEKEPQLCYKWPFKTEKRFFFQKCQL